MKRTIALMLALVMVLGMAGCGKSDEVKSVEALINAIGDVNTESENIIQRAKAAYDALPENEQKKVKNYSLLENAYNLLYQMYANNVVELIDAIGEVSISSADKISAAIDAYNGLSIEQQQMVRNHSVLVEAAAIWAGKYAFTGNYFSCRRWMVTDKEYDEITKSNSTFISLLAEKDSSYLQISDNYDKFLFVNQYGTFFATIVTRKDKNAHDEIYYMAEKIEWEEAPTIIEGHKVTFSQLQIWPNRGEVFFNFVLDGGENVRDFWVNVSSSENALAVFEEFEIYVP